MNIYAVALVIFLTFAVVPLGVAWWMGRDERVSLARLADPAPLPGEVFIEESLIVSQALGVPVTIRQRANGEKWAELGEQSAYGPFPVDTGPLLIVSETTAAGAALDRWARGAVSETDWLIEAGEREIGPVQ